jgi:hypothetical protein
MTSTKLSNENAKNAILAGKAKITIKNSVTGNHFTYSVKRAKARVGNLAGMWFVSVLSGPDNVSNYRYAGIFTEAKSLRVTAKSKIGADAPSFRVFNTVLNTLFAGTLNPIVEIWHEGTCCRCGRALTHPESIETGIGPECTKLRSKNR